jgi:selenide,water dikinase
VNIGSTVGGLDVPGVREHALSSRPIASLIDRVSLLIDRARSHLPGSPFHLVVVGAGAAGVELAFTFQHRLSREAGRPIRVTVLHDDDAPLSAHPARLIRMLERRAAERGIEFRGQHRVVSVEADGVCLADGRRLECDGVVWAAGPASAPLFRESGLRTDEDGYGLVRPTLQLVEHDHVFAVGDCATLVDRPATPKAGVYAVRQGPVVARNLRAALTGAPLRPYEPQRDFLMLLNLADGRAAGRKWGLAFEGRWVMWLKDRIDRAFMRRFQFPER